ncbi:MAG: Glycosyl transferase family 2 [Parcubacteria group bacterium GW2011_GWA2_43_11]|nr:MAG: Glycosyl transferase family 2 [Parcubacteria group bacterium GW2011_GWA2_43_11]
MHNTITSKSTNGHTCPVSNGMKVSIVLPIYNEEKNIPILYKEIKEVCEKNNIVYEVLAVDDGSRDRSFAELTKIAEQDKNVKILRFRFNCGQTAAMAAGMKMASGDIVIPMDADLQNDPADIPNFLKKIDEGKDVVCGWRKDRKDTFVTRKIPSLIANALIRKITGVHVHDYGCTMKAFRREVIQGIQLYGEMHRFIPMYASAVGGKITEIEVHHRPRTYGTTKYGLGRVYKVLLDLIVVKFLHKYMNRPMHFFGGVGFVSFFFGVLAGTTAVVLKLLDLRSFVETPLPIFSALLIIVGVQLLAMGVIAEMLMRVYYESQNKTPYEIVEILNK